jgi:hypothetical protein
VVSVKGGAGVTGTDNPSGSATFGLGNSTGAGLASILFVAPPTRASGTTVNTSATIAQFSKTSGGTSATTGIYSFVANATGGALATNAIDGFVYVGSGAGTPTGVPTAFTGANPLYVDATNNLLYFYSGSWIKSNTGAAVPTLGAVVHAGNVVNNTSSSGQVTWQAGGTYAAGSTGEIYGPTDTGFFVT